MQRGNQRLALQIFIYIAPLPELEPCSATALRKVKTLLESISMGYLPYNAAKLTKVSCGLVKDCRPHQYLYPISRPPPEETEDPPLAVLSLIFRVTHRVTQGAERMRVSGEVKQGAQCSCL